MKPLPEASQNVLPLTNILSLFPLWIKIFNTGQITSSRNKSSKDGCVLGVNLLIKLTCGHDCEALFWLLIDVGRPNPGWMVASWGWWVWKLASPGSMGAHAYFNPNIWDAEAGICLSPRESWSSWWVPSPSSATKWDSASNKQKVSWIKASE